MNELPEGWKLVKLGEICKMKNGFAFKSTEYTDEGTPVIRISDINGGIVSTEKSVRVKDKNEFEDFLVEKGDILVAMSGATTGKFGLFGTNEKAYQNQRVGKFKILNIKVLDRQFLYYQINSLKRLIEKDAYGGAQPNISSGKIEQMNFVLPPLTIQHAIVTKIEEIFSELDHGVEQLKTARAQLKVYRQAVLKWAFEGRLTNEVIEEGELPDGWKWVKLGEVADMCLGKMLDKQKNIGTLKPYLGNINVRWGKFNLDDLPQMRFEAKEKERYNLKKGDLVICEGGEPGRAAIWKEQVPEMKIQKALHRVRFDKNTSTEFFHYYLQLIAQAKKLDQYFTGTTIKHLTGQSLKKIEFPLPPLPEQHQIVSEIERRLSVCDKLEETIEAGLKQAEVLRAGVLKMAFEGRLVGS